MAVGRIQVAKQCREKFSSVLIFIRYSRIEVATHTVLDLDTTTVGVYA